MQSLGDSSRDAPPDHAGVAFHPPILLVAFLLLGFVLRAIVPLSFAPEQSVDLIGPIIVMSFVWMFFWAIATMRRSGGSIPTGEPTDVIVHTGAFRYSRNPIYVSMVALLIGAGVWGNTLWLIGLAVLGCVSPMVGRHLTRGRLFGAKVWFRLHIVQISSPQVAVVLLPERSVPCPGRSAWNAILGLYIQDIEPFPLVRTIPHEPIHHLSVGLSLPLDSLDGSSMSFGSVVSVAADYARPTPLTANTRTCCSLPLRV